MKKLLFLLTLVVGLTQFSSAAITTCTTIKKDLSYRASDTFLTSDVANLQYFLNQTGDLVYYPSGYFGTATLIAVKQFQKSYGISATGYVGPVTKSKIKELSCGLSAISSNDNTYVNTAGNTVHSPTYTENNVVPQGATAQCGDGTYSFSQSSRGTCSHHGGVSRWLR